MNDSQFPWLILVPMKNDIAEIIDLSEEEQVTLLRESAQASKALQALFSPLKLNVAALGNVVRQLHVHHVARFDTDCAWPKPVWGNQPTVAYDTSKAQALVEMIQQWFKNNS